MIPPIATTSKYPAIASKSGHAPASPPASVSGCCVPTRRRPCMPQQHRQSDQSRSHRLHGRPNSRPRPPIVGMRLLAHPQRSSRTCSHAEWPLHDRGRPHRGSAGSAACVALRRCRGGLALPTHRSVGLRGPCAPKYARRGRSTRGRRRARPFHGVLGATSLESSSARKAAPTSSRTFVAVVIPLWVRDVRLRVFPVRSTSIS